MAANPNIFPLANACLQFTQDLYSHPLSYFFRKPYKPITKDDDYYEVIKKPMDLSTVRKKLLNREYVSIRQWESDIRLIFTNSILYNGETHLLGGISAYFLKKIDKFMTQIEDSNSRNFEVKTRKLFNEVLKLIREMPIVYKNEIADVTSQGNNEIQSQNIIQDQVLVNPDQNNEQVQNEENANQIISQNQSVEVSNQYINHKPEDQDISETDIQEQKEVFNDNIEANVQVEFPFASFNPQGYGDFNQSRIRQIKDDLNNVGPEEKLKKITFLIHYFDPDFRCFDPKEIDVASMSKRALIGIEEYLKNYNSTQNTPIDQSLVVKSAGNGSPVSNASSVIISNSNCNNVNIINNNINDTSNPNVNNANITDNNINKSENIIINSVNNANTDDSNNVNSNNTDTISSTIKNNINTNSNNSDNNAIVSNNNNTVNNNNNNTVNINNNNNTVDNNNNNTFNSNNNNNTVNINNNNNTVNNNNNTFNSNNNNNIFSINNNNNAFNSKNNNTFNSNNNNNIVSINNNNSIVSINNNNNAFNSNNNYNAFNNNSKNPDNRKTVKNKKIVMTNVSDIFDVPPYNDSNSITDPNKNVNDRIAENIETNNNNETNKQE